MGIAQRVLRKPRRLCALPFLAPTNGAISPSTEIPKLAYEPESPKLSLLGLTVASLPSRRSASLLQPS